MLYWRKLVVLTYVFGSDNILSIIADTVDVMRPMSFIKKGLTHDESKSAELYRGYCPRRAAR